LPQKREAEKFMERCFQLLTFEAIQFLDLPKANKKWRKTRNKHPLRVVDGDEKAAMPEVSALMKHAKEKIKLSFAIDSKKTLLKKIMEIIEILGETNQPSFVWGCSIFESRKITSSHTG
jgi:hypothetical protein